MLGFIFDGEGKMLWLDAFNPGVLLMIHKGWIRSSRGMSIGIPFTKFQSVIAKVRHTFTAIPLGRGLLSPFNG